MLKINTIRNQSAAQRDIAVLVTDVSGTSLVSLLVGNATALKRYSFWHTEECNSAIEKTVHIRIYG